MSHSSPLLLQEMLSDEKKNYAEKVEELTKESEIQLSEALAKHAVEVVVRID